MSITIRLLAFTGVFLLLLPRADVYQTTDMAEINVLIVPFISHLMGIIGSVYLAAQLYTIAERASITWKYLSTSIVLFALWNIIMAFNIMLKALNIGSVDYLQNSSNTLYLIEVIDPVLEAFVFIIFFYGMRKVANAMHNKPWTVFSKEDSDE